MASDGFDFPFNIFDKITGPADAMVAALDKLGGALDRTSKATDKINKEAGGHFFTFDLAKGLELGKDLIGEVIGKTAELGKEMITSAANSERLLLSFKTLLGPEGANAVIESVNEISKRSAFDDDQLLQAIRPLVQKGIRGEDLNRALIAALEVESQKGGGIGEVQNVISGFERIKQTGTVNARSLSEMGVEAKDVFNIIGKAFGVSAKGAEKLAESGKVGATNLFNAVEQALAAKTGGVIGKGAIEAGSTLEASLRKLQQLPDQFFKKLANTEAFDKIKVSLDRVLKALDPDGPNGKKIQDFIVKVFDKMASAIEFATEPGRIDDFVNELQKIPGVVDSIVTGIEVIGTVWAGISIVSGVTALIGLLPALATGLGTVVGFFAVLSAPVLAVAAAFVAVGAAIYRIVDAIKELGGVSRVLDDFKEFFGGNGPAIAGNNPRFKGFGTKSAQGFQEGLAMSTADANAAGQSMGDAAVDGLSSSLDIHSPSRVFERLGRMTGAGFAQGIAGDSTAQTATADMVSTPSVGGGLGGGNTFNISINVSAGGSSSGGEDSSGSIAQRLADLMPSAIEDALEKLALESGAVA